MRNFRAVRTEVTSGQKNNTVYFSSLFVCIALYNLNCCFRFCLPLDRYAIAGLDPGQTPYFIWAESNADEKKPLFSLISIRFGPYEVWRLTQDLVLFKETSSWIWMANALLLKLCRDSQFIDLSKPEKKGYSQVHWRTETEEIIMKKCWFTKMCEVFSGPWEISVQYLGDERTEKQYCIF